jgi:hypothetical protein
MGSRFLLSFVIAFIVTLTSLGGIGWGIANLTIAPPREQFATSYFSFDLAPGWRCELEDTEYVCNPPGKAPFPAIVIMAMKERNEKDRGDEYEAHLRQPQPIKLADGSSGLSEVKFVRRTTIGGKEWIEALHIGSEVPNFHTYYMATTTSLLGILVTMSVHRHHTDAFVRQLTEMMRSLSVHQR